MILFKREYFTQILYLPNYLFKQRDWNFFLSRLYFDHRNLNREKKYLP